MPLRIDPALTVHKLAAPAGRMFDLSAQKILSLEKSWKPASGAPVFTVKGRYASRGWTEWTQGFQFGSGLLQFDATGDRGFLDSARRNIVAHMSAHVSHHGVHDHGFNNISTYGNLVRLMHEEKIEWNDREKEFYELALKVSGAVQASRWTSIADGTGFIHSFNGPHSLFVDTIRSCRSLAVAHQLGQVLGGEQDARISLLQRLVEHVINTARFNVFHGEQRDRYDVPGRTAHEAIFNVSNGSFRCCNSQQGFSPFTTWTRGLAWALCGFAEQLEFLRTVPRVQLDTARPLSADASRTVRRPAASRGASGPLFDIIERAANVTAEFYLANCCSDGIPMWDTGAPNLHRLPSDYLERAADPFNQWEPVDSSAAAIAAQGFIRLGNYWRAGGDKKQGARYRQAGFTITRTLLSAPYLSIQPKHQGLLLHSVYHRPNGWDSIAAGQQVPNGESSMWGDYHLRELALLILREAEGAPYPTFFGCAPHTP